MILGTNQALKYQVNLLYNYTGVTVRTLILH